MHPPKSPRTRLVLASALGGLAAALLACHEGASSAEVTATTQPLAQPEAKKPSSLPDADIAQAIERHFQDEALLRSKQVKVAVTQGIATISGTVDNLLAKERALHVAETIKGVRSVIDQVAVTPSARTDQQIKSDVVRALHDDVATRPYPIGITVTDGKVNLSGTADSWQQKYIFADVAKEVPGVTALDNAVAVHYAGVVRPDSEILADVKNRIGNDVWLDGDILGVTVTAHTVYVSGSVGSVAQKRRADSDGWVAGVEGVDDRGIMVDWFAERDQRDLARDYPLKSDAQIQQAVRDAFQLDPRLKTLVPQVAVHDGSIVLSGIVAGAKARLAAEADARDTVGAWSVRDEVVVPPGGAPTDDDISKAIKRLFADDELLSDGKSIQVSTAHGNVVLTGIVTSNLGRMDAIADVGRVPGVAEVDDHLVVQRSPEEIKASIDDRLSWDPMVESDLVSVAVAPNGDATLRGTVNDWSEIKAATQDALRGGATRVINVLKLKNHPELSVR
jgi:osmotically-inducible protein OsmY